ncbi:MAG: AsmA family protein, partial [Candidatus Auribacterota bacterium]|nr:AsmA family protein [Candidatus Auribacterota bacterium]
MKKKVSMGKKILIVVIIAALLLVIVAIAGIIYLNHYLNSPEFLVKIREEAQAQAGVDIQIGSLSASIFKGFIIKNVVLGSPVEGDPPIFSVDEVLLKYNLGDLLGKKITINKVLIVSPLIKLKKDREGEWIIPGSKKESEKPIPSGKKEGKEEVPSKKGSAWKISIESLQVTDGSVELIMGKKYDPVRIEGINLNARLLQLTEPREIDGRLDIDGISLKGDRLVSSLGADLHLRGMENMTAAIKAVVAGGDLSGSMKADLKDSSRIPYQADLDLKEINIAILMKPFAPQEGGTKVTGNIFGNVKAGGYAPDSDS